MKKLLFIDVDGTLTDKHGAVRELTRDAVKKARENGHVAILCTGRSKPEIIPEILEVGFDGLIGANGAYIEYQNEVLFETKLPKDLVVDILDYFNEQKIGYYLETNHGLYGSVNFEEVLVKVPDGLTLQSAKWFLDLLKPITQKVNLAEVNKISYISITVENRDIVRRYSDRADVVKNTVFVFGKDSGEIAVKNINKFTAIRYLISQKQLSHYQTIAIGDGDNDLKMFEAVEVGIAMGNASENLKKIANQLTEDVEEDGFYHAFIRNGLI